MLCFTPRRTRSPSSSRAPASPFSQATLRCKSGSMISWWPISSMPSVLGRSSTLTVRPVLRLLVEVDRDQAVQIVAEVVGDRHGLDEDLGHDDGAARFHPRACPSPATTLHSRPEIDERRLAEGRTGDVRVHVRCRCRARERCTGCRAGRPPARGSIRHRGNRECRDAGLPPSPGRARFPSRCARRSRRRRPSRGMPNCPAGSWAGRSRWSCRRGEFEIVDRGRAVQRHRLEDALLNQSTRYGAQPVLMTCPPRAAATNVSMAMRG